MEILDGLVKRIQVPGGLLNGESMLPGWKSSMVVRVGLRCSNHILSVLTHVDFQQVDEIHSLLCAFGAYRI
jgi:hypothetical protein